MFCHQLCSTSSTRDEDKKDTKSKANDFLLNFNYLIVVTFTLNNEPRLPEDMQMFN